MPKGRKNRCDGCGKSSDRSSKSVPVAGSAVRSLPRGGGGSELRVSHRAGAAQLEVGFERVTETLTSTGALDPKSFAALSEALDRSAGAARTMAELFAAYRSAIADATEAVLRPVPARQDRSLRSAIDHIRQHYSEKLSLAKVARVAGFYPSYFSELFRQRERITFETYVAQLRLARAAATRRYRAGSDARGGALGLPISFLFLSRVPPCGRLHSPALSHAITRSKFMRKPKLVQTGRRGGRVG